MSDKSKDVRDLPEKKIPNEKADQIKGGRTAPSTKRPG
jgi:hypothetical protein